MSVPFVLQVYLFYCALFKYLLNLDLGEVKVYFLKGQKQSVSHWKSAYKIDGVTQKYIVTVLTMLDFEYPLVYNIMEARYNIIKCVLIYNLLYLF